MVASATMTLLLQLPLLVDAIIFTDIVVTYVVIIIVLIIAITTIATQQELEAKRFLTNLTMRAKGA